MKKQTATFTFERDTKNSIRFQEEGSGPFIIGNQYIQKWALGDNPPKRIKITIEPAE